MQPVKKFIMKEDPKHIRISEFNYPLPDERIAKFPLPVRDQSKLLVYRHGEVSEDRFTSLPSYLPTGSLMIFNNTKVIQARLHFRKETGALIEVFCLEPIEPNDYVLNFQQTEHAAWLCMIGNLKKWKEGTLKREMTVKEQPITLTATRGECHGTSHWVDFRWDNPEITFADILEVFGELPIPPYLNRDTQESDKETYQTVYSKIKGFTVAAQGLTTPHSVDQENDFSNNIHTIYVSICTDDYMNRNTQKHSGRRCFLSISVYAASIYHVYLLSIDLLFY